MIVQGTRHGIGLFVDGPRPALSTPRATVVVVGQRPWGRARGWCAVVAAVLALGACSTDSSPAPLPVTGGPGGAAGGAINVAMASNGGAGDVDAPVMARCDPPDQRPLGSVCTCG